jgi:flagellar secretion chaperone FliS
MNTNTMESAIAYQQSSAFSASAVGQVVALYDRILRDLRQAIQALEAGQIERRISSLNHALTIIGELQGVLDFEHGADVARKLNSFYNVTRAMVMQAGVNSSAATMEELVSMFTRLRAAWAQVEKDVPAAEPTQRLRVSSQPQAAFSQNPPAPVPAEGVQESGGGWRA